MTTYLYMPAILLTPEHGWVGLFYENSLPVTVRNDLSSDESIVVEFQTFLSNFKQLY